MAVLVGVMLGRLFGVVLGVDMMALSHMRVMTGDVMVAALVVVSRRLMMPGGMLVVFSSFSVMFGSLL